MQRISALDPAVTAGKSKDYFNAIEKKLGMVPNMMRTMGQSPAVLNGYLSFGDALGEGSLGAKLGELIAITVANVNGCGYCNAAHSFIGSNLLKITDETIELAKRAQSHDLKINAVLQFAKTIVEKKGRIQTTDLNAIRNAGYSDAAITEIIAHVGLNIFTNYFNTALEVVIDFPKSELTALAA